jgi:hypothetical protein
MKNLLLTLILAAGMHAVTAQALDDSDGFKIIQNGDWVIAPALPKAPEMKAGAF